MTQSQREGILHLRKQCRHPWHSPPHFGIEPNLYHITAACYEHRKIITSPDRLTAFESDLLSGLSESGVAEVRVWALLPNHYHMLVKTSLPEFGKWIHRLHNKTATRWNGEDGQRGRKVWHCYSDRLIRGEVHYFRTVNYIHANPVKHGYVGKSQKWPWSSYTRFEEKYGREALVEWWHEYPTTGCGKGWDD